MKTVLLIEDNADIRENICEILELENYKVFSLENGSTAFAFAKTNKPSIILCDIMMPVMDGYEVLKQLKNDPVTIFIPFIFITASAEKEEFKKGYDMGANGYISKPFSADVLLDTIKHCLIPLQ